MYHGIRWLIEFLQVPGNQLWTLYSQEQGGKQKHPGTPQQFLQILLPAHVTSNAGAWAKLLQQLPPITPHVCFPEPHSCLCQMESGSTTIQLQGVSDTQSPAFSLLSFISHGRWGKEQVKWVKGQGHTRMFRNHTRVN